MACVSARADFRSPCCVIPAQKAAEDCRSPKAGAGSKRPRNSRNVLNCASPLAILAFSFPNSSLGTLLLLKLRFSRRTRIRDCDYLITEILDKLRHWRTRQVVRYVKVR